MNVKSDFFSRKNLILLCTFEALVHTSISLLRFFFNTVIVNYIDSILSSVVIIFAIIYFFKNHSILSLDKDVFLLVFMLLYLVISCVARTITSGQDWLNTNANYMVDLEVLIIIYLLGKYYGKNGVPNILVNIFQGIIIIWSVIMLYLLINVLAGNLISAPSGAILCRTEIRSFILGVNRNHTGAYSCVFCLLSLCMFVWRKNNTFRFLFIPAMLINYILLVLSNSRTAILAAIIGFSLIIGVITFIYWNSKSFFKRILISILFGLAAGIILFFLRYPVTSVYSSIRTGSTGTAVLPREIINENSSLLSGRTHLWKISLDLMFTSRFMFCGVTPAGIFKDIFAVSNSDNPMLNTHNQFLEVGTTMGIPALIAFVIWCVIIIVACWHIYFVKKYQNGILLFPMLLAAFFAMSFTEAYLLFYEHFVAYVFFFISGIIYSKSDIRLNPLLKYEFKRFK